MQPPQGPKKRMVYEHVTGVGLVVLSVASVVITVVLAVKRNDRLPWMVAVTLLLLFLTAINGLRVRLAFKSLQRNLHLSRRAHARKGVILEFPKQYTAQAEKKDPEEKEDPS